MLIIGNSGSGKTTLGRRLARQPGARFQSLDALAFAQGATRKALDESIREGLLFLRAQPVSVLEGCYADIAQGLANELDYLVLLNPGTATCIAHCRGRPYEPDKYESEQAQNAMLDKLIEWVSTYDEREDEYGLSAHRALFNAFPATKIELTTPSSYEEELRRAMPQMSAR